MTYGPSDFDVNLAIVRCSLCDLSGYRLGSAVVCDHIDHRPAYDRGMAAVRAVLDQHRKDSVRPTILARNEAFEQQRLVDRQRQAAPPAKLPGLTDE